MSVDQAKTELAQLKNVMTTGSPHILLEKSVDLTSLLSGVNEQMAEYESAYYKLLKGYLSEVSSAAKAEHLARATDDYKQYRIAQGIGKALEKAITGLRSYAERLMEEMKLGMK